MPTRNESVVYFDEYVRAEPVLEYLEHAKAEFDANMTHVIVAACNIALAKHPAMNKFVVGKRMYMRNARWFTFADKRKKKDAKSKLGIVKLRMEDGETFRQLVERINGSINAERSGKKTELDKELSVVLLAPRFVLAILVRIARYLDYLNLLPRFFIDGEGMYTSVFIANLGSVGLGAGYHHLYEWGTAPIFIMTGKIEEKPCVGADGQIEVGKVLHIRISFDERTDDGLTAGLGVRTVHEILTDPAAWLGGLQANGTVDLPMWPRSASD